MGGFDELIVILQVPLRVMLSDELDSKPEVVHHASSFLQRV